MRIVTDSTPLEVPKDPDACNVFTLYKLFASDEQIEEMAGQYRAGGYGYGSAKKALFELVRTTLEPYRRRRNELESDRAHVESVLQKGAERARDEAERTLKAARRALGLD